MNSFTEHNTREQIAHLLEEGKKVALSSQESIDTLAGYLSEAEKLLSRLLANQPTTEA